MATVRELVRPVEAVTYGWKTRGFGVAPEIAASELRAIHGASGTVSPDQIVERARDPESPLHPVFDWNDTTAAAAYREVQARHLLRNLTVVYRKPSGELTPPMRYMVKLRYDADDVPLDDMTEQATEPRAYLPVQRIMDEAELRRRYVRQAFTELQNWRTRYREIDDFATVFNEIDRLAAKLGGAA